MVKQQQKEEALFVVAIYNQILLIVQSDLVSSFFLVLEVSQTKNEYFQLLNVETFFDLYCIFWDISEPFGYFLGSFRASCNPF